MTDLARMTEALLDAALKAGAEAADALAVAGTSLAIDIRQGKLEQAERAEGVEIGLRVLIGGRQAIVAARRPSRRCTHRSPLSRKADRSPPTAATSSVAKACAVVAVAVAGAAIAPSAQRRPKALSPRQGKCGTPSTRKRRTTR